MAAYDVVRRFVLPGQAKGLVVICHNPLCLSIEKGRIRTMQGYGDNFILVIPLEDDKHHTQEYPFCPNDTCPCREDQEALSSVNAALLNGLLTPGEATAFVQGRMV